MKKILATALSLLCLSGVCFAQGFKEAIEQDPAKLAGNFYVYDSDVLPASTPAPEGYKPFYISQFARHGARYCTSEYDAMQAGTINDDIRWVHRRQPTDDRRNRK